MDKVKNAVQPHVNKLNNYLQTSNDPLVKLLTNAEQKTGVNRLHLLLGGLVLATLILVWSSGMALLSTAIGFGFPAYRSFKAVETPNKDDDTQWLIYWTVFGFFAVLEHCADAIIFWFPFYHTVKLAFMVWCFWPGPGNGSHFIYYNFLRKFLVKHEKDIDHTLSQGSDLLKQGAQKAAAAAVNSGALSGDNSKQD